MAMGASASVLAIIMAIATKSPNYSIRLLLIGNIKLKQERLKEHELYEKYKSVWGIISPPHYHTLQGSGWWRVRYKMVVDAGSIVAGDVGETSIFGKGYEKNPQEVEDYIKRYGIQGLARIRDEQASDFKNKVWTKEKCIKFFKDYIK